MLIECDSVSLLQLLASRLISDKLGHQIILCQLTESESLKCVARDRVRFSNNYRQAQ